MLPKNSVKARKAHSLLYQTKKLQIKSNWLLPESV